MTTRLASLGLRLPMAGPAFVLILCLALLVVSLASAQTSTTGNIEGTVTDTTGAAIPGVTVIAIRAGGGSASATTNDEGLFRLTNLQPGKYTVVIDATKGFARFEQQNVEVNLSRTTNLTWQLRPAAAGETVTVTPGSGPAVEKSTQTTEGNAGKVTTGNGLTTITFEPNVGTIRVYLPDDMRAGDTISGTVVTEPKGTTSEEKVKNQAKLDTYVLDLQGTKVPANGPRFTWTPTTPLPSQPTRYQLRLYEVLSDQTASAALVAEALITRPAIRSPLDNLPTMSPVTSSTGEVLNQFRMPDSTIFSIDVAAEKATDYPLRQQGRPVEIFGPFDGNLSNTTLRYGPAKSTIQDFEKNTENVSGGFGLLRSLAESPRKIVFESPTNVTGPIGIMVKEKDSVGTGTYRNVGVQLSAPKTNLLKGEKTILTIEVRGLEGIQKPVPLTLTSEGVITMEGGPYQPLMIQPSQVDAGGRYSTTRGVTGIQAGGWGATATVVTGRFNIWLQDDSDPNRLFHFNSFTGDYVFACGGGSCRSGSGETSSQPPTGSSAPPPPVTLTGIGKPAMKGCIITLTHNAPDRRVFARLDACTKTGEASVETKSPKANFNINDKDTTDNKVASPPPK